MEKSGKDIRELHALLRMLDEPDRDLYDKISNVIVSFGYEAIDDLEKLTYDTTQPVVSKRASALIKQIKLSNTINELKVWKESANQDILQAWLIIESFLHPEADHNNTKEKANILYKDIWLEFNSSLTAIEKAAIINHMFFSIYNFSIPKSQDDGTDSYFAGKILNNKTLNHITLWMLYLHIAQRLGLPLYGKKIENVCLMMWFNDKGEDQISFIDEDRMLFAVVAENAGPVFDEAQLTTLFNNAGVFLPPDFFSKTDNTYIITTYLEELGKTYEKAGNKERAEDIKEIRMLLSI